MLLGKLIKLLDAEEAEKSRGLLRISYELLQDSAFDLGAYLQTAFAEKTTKRRGNCYATSEALYHLLGGKGSGWKPMRMRWQRDTHWFLQNIQTGQILDATARQFTKPPDYSKARGSGFLTKKPSRAARQLMQILLWQKR